MGRNSFPFLFFWTKKAEFRIVNLLPNDRICLPLFSPIFFLFLPLYHHRIAINKFNEKNTEDYGMRDQIDPTDYAIFHSLGLFRSRN